MNSFIFACLLIVSVSAVTKPPSDEVQFKAFQFANNRNYKTKTEEAKRFAIFKENLRSIEDHNALFKKGLKTWTQSVNQFADLTKEEFSAILGAKPEPSISGTKYIQSKLPVPSSVDWRTRKQVNKVRDQGTTCGSGWAFALTGANEAAYYRKHGQPISLSVQQLIDCSTIIGDGCRGGLKQTTFKYLLQTGLEAESDYPYTGKDRFCLSQRFVTKTKISNYIFLAPGNENQLFHAVGTVGPVAVTIDASNLAFYESGVYSDSSSSKNAVSHGVLAVGYGSESGKDYWIIKNSWGSNWGENGYFKILRGKNVAGIAERGVFPLIN